MNFPTPNLDQAFALIGQLPLPADAFARLMALDTAATPEEAEYFGDMWEAFYAAGGRDPDSPL